jgi:UDP-N-acetylmuramate dehydrogenase
MIDSLVIETGVDLSHRNTLGFNSRCEYYCEPKSEAQVDEALAFAKEKGLCISVLGGGSNILISPHIDGLVICPMLKEQSITEGQDDVQLHAGAGIEWHSLVEWSIEQRLSGLETLALIPGHVGAAPIQNIGAYGVEVKDRLVSVRAFDRAQQQWRTLRNAECDFGYRDSLFKRHPGRFIVTSVAFSLNRSNKAQPIRYAALANAIDHPSPSTKHVFDAVCAMRRSKLPDPAIIGNAGSFFKNPVIEAPLWEQIQTRYPDAVGFDAEPGYKKMAAGWLIDRLGWKGKQQGAVGVYPKQALVLTHQGGGTLDELLALANEIQSSVRDNFSIDLEIEPQLFPQSDTLR